MLLGLGATSGENIRQQICHCQCYHRDSEASLWERNAQFQNYISEMLEMNDCYTLGEHWIRKGLNVNFILINESSGSYLHDSKIDYIKFYSAQLNFQFKYNSKSSSISNAWILNRRR